MLDLEVTRRCNLRCDYCFVGWSRDWKSHLDYATAEAIVREGAGRFDTFHVTGGEPLAWHGIFDLVDLAMSLGYRSTLINTNGTLLDDVAIARLARHQGKVGLSISFDGPAALHDPIRGEGNFARSDANLGRALAAGIPVTVMTVVTPAVLAVLPDFLVERHRSHPRIMGVTLFPVGVGPSGTHKPGASIRELGPDDVKLLAAQVALAARAGLRVQVGAYPMINPLLRKLGYPEALLYQCTAGRGRVCVHADLGVSSCHPVRQPIYGTWEPGLFDRIPGLEVHRRMGARDYDGCRTCPEQERCGHCRAYVTATVDDLFGNDLVCHDVVPGRREAWTAAHGAPARPRRYLAVVR
ncbi:MAG TPA: radical SAM protein [Kofleriaceae bacterium]|nr:radical SAM protein [Kofleriaceae bacterium]